MIAQAAFIYGKESLLYKPQSKHEMNLELNFRPPKIRFRAQRFTGILVQSSACLLLPTVHTYCLGAQRLSSCCGILKLDKDHIYLALALHYVELLRSLGMLHVPQ